MHIICSPARNPQLWIQYTKEIQSNNNNNTKIQLIHANLRCDCNFSFEFTSIDQIDQTFTKIFQPSQRSHNFHKWKLLKAIWAMIKRIFAKIHWPNVLCNGQAMLLICAMCCVRPKYLITKQIATFNQVHCKWY